MLYSWARHYIVNSGSFIISNFYLVIRSIYVWFIDFVA